MLKFSLALAVVSMLSLGSVALAADKASTSPKDTRFVESASQPSHPGDLQPAGLYMGPDGVLHNVPKGQDPRLSMK